MNDFISKIKSIVVAIVHQSTKGPLSRAQGSATTFNQGGFNYENQ